MAPQVDPSRRVAFDVMAAVRTSDAYVNLTLPKLLTERAITGRDAAFATELTHGTIRRQGSYDAVIEQVSRRAATAIDPPVLDVLRLGAHQILTLRTPSHAAVDTSVNLVRAVSGHRPASFVNACLRKMSTRPFDAWMKQVAPADPLGRLAVVHSHPRWIVEEFHRSLDGDMAELEQLLEADNAAPSVTLVARPGLSDRADLPGTPGRWSPYAMTMESGDPGSLPGVRTGTVGVQDEGSQLVAIAAAAAAVSGSDAAWLDLCAGPGGKAALLGALAAQRDATLVAAELHPHRATLVESAVRRLSNVTVLTTDSTDPPWPAGSFDRVVADVPCTGLGALRRRPEARWRRSAADVAPLAHLQRRLLGAAIDAVRPGGVVCYATCTPVLAETVEVVEWVHSGRPDVEVLDASAVLDVSGLSGPYVQLWPHLHGTDAMFIALLRR